MIYYTVRKHPWFDDQPWKELPLEEMKRRVVHCALPRAQIDTKHLARESCSNSLQ
jgi:hypothetical protein